MQHSCRMKFFSIIIGTLSLATIQIEGFCKEAALNDIANGAKIWADNCARCHNPRSATEFPKDSWQTIMMHMRLQAGLTGQEARDVLEFLVPEFAPSPEPAASTQVKGEATQEPKAQDPKISTNKTTVLADNTIASDKAKTEKSSDNVSKLTGQAIYQQTCVACHGANGKGAVPGTPDLTKSNGPLSQSNAILIKHIKEGFQKPGDPMAMPPKGGNSNLTDEDIKNVLYYIEKTYKH